MVIHRIEVKRLFIELSWTTKRKKSLDHREFFWEKFHFSF